MIVAMGFLEKVHHFWLLQLVEINKIDIINYLIRGLGFILVN